MSTLVIYSTKYEFTRECVEEMKSHLQDRDITTINIHKDPIPNPATFNSIIIGGSIYMGMLNKAIKNFCREHEEVLLTKQLGLFITCSSMDEAAENQIKTNFQEAIYNHAVVKDYLGGALNMTKASFFHKLIIKMVSKGDQSKQKRSDGPLHDRIKTFAKAMNS